MKETAYFTGYTSEELPKLSQKIMVIFYLLEILY